MSDNLYSHSEYKLEPKFSYRMEGTTFKRMCMYARMPHKTLQLGRAYCRIKSNGVLYIVICIISANPKLLIYPSPAFGNHNFVFAIDLSLTCISIALKSQITDLR